MIRRTPRRSLSAQFERGEGGRWRWYLRDGEDLVAESPVHGYDSREAAWQSLRDLFDSRLEGLG